MNDLLAAFALLLILEGLAPLCFPQQWKEAYTAAQRLSATPVPPFRYFRSNDGQIGRGAGRPVGR
ncbi:MAG: DUF2065 family protein [Xanthomonadales bacterium]|nr:DUF2065 family protein [Xanthomonadales bacterium]